ncbi:Uncharacterised protein [Corynebacterium diphtheriae]|nr:Uncharacterised protein [Corynebacterium diphtheriae]
MTNNEGMCKHCGAAVLFVKDDRWHVFDAKPSEEGEWRIRSRWAANVAAEKTTVTRLTESKLRRACLMGEPLFRPHFQTCPANHRAKILQEKRRHG